MEFNALYTNNTHVSTDRRWLVYENITGYLKNHWTKHRLACTHSDQFSKAIPNMTPKLNNFEIFEKFSDKKNETIDCTQELH